jgi:proteasome lid subunit RPN8/RPN11
MFRFSRAAPAELPGHPDECVGLLAGRVCRDSAGTYTVVTGAVLSEAALTGRGSVRTTVEAEKAAAARLGKRFPIAERVGWFHSHPGIGAYFSGTDKLNQQTWTSPQSVGIVVDHTDEERCIAAFLGPDSQGLPCLNRRAVVEALRAVGGVAARGPRPVPEAAAGALAEEGAGTSWKKGKRRLVLAACGALIALLVFLLLPRGEEVCRRAFEESLGLAALEESLGCPAEAMGWLRVAMIQAKDQKERDLVVGKLAEAKLREAEGAFLRGERGEASRVLEALEKAASALEWPGREELLESVNGLRKRLERRAVEPGRKQWVDAGGTSWQEAKARLWQFLSRTARWLRVSVRSTETAPGKPVLPPTGRGSHSG